MNNRNNIVFKTLCGESANVDKDLCQDWKSRLPIILAGYEDRDVYNLDETGLFFRALPTKSLVEKAEVAKGGKQAKQRLTVCFCANAADCDKNSSQIIQSITVLDAIRWIRHAWENVKGQTIVNCFKKCELSNTALEATIDAADLENEVVELSKAAAIQYDPNSDKYENGLECYDDLSED
ncbi:tigger transposable element-derived protein 6-like [Parasteatoda tepidariorum]|uniref:tigger transposable element-derived protein 6-like n=1 Tax=Parasteatoda tepidariorum TaxID=114398 RepID=UPI001C71CA79|nr:tigger transposable element-derived protein 6-like [Parasteatoda tepidariorum]